MGGSRGRSNPTKWRAYGLAALSVVLAMLVSDGVPALRDRTPYLAVLGAVFVASSYGGLGPGLFATVVGGIATDYLLVPPIYQAIGSPGDVERLTVLVMLGVLTSLRSAEIRRNVEEREQLLRAAEVANRTKDQFLAMVSHDLRSPLATIRMWANLLRTRKVDEATTAKGLCAIESSTIMQARLVEDLLDLSRIVSGKLRVDHRAVDLASVVRAVLDATRTSAQDKRVRVEHEIDRPVGLVWGDAARLQQIIWNLVSNAIKFTPKDGRVDVCLERHGDRARVIVRDTGEGIAPDALPHVFERFCQEDSSGTRRLGGLGLGLAIAHHLVEAHGGTIEAQSPGKGQGATFVVTLPLAARAGSQASAVQQDEDAAGSESEPILGRVAVLVVDDDQGAREAIATALERSGANVRAVESAPAAVAALGREGADVLLTDIAMPGGDGYGLLTDLRDRGIEIPAAALTGLDTEADQRRASAAGFGAYLTKPVNVVQLVETIAMLANVPVR